MGPGRVLVTDLDGTLLGSDAALARFNAWLADRRDDYRLVYASGRRIWSVLGLVDDGVLPAPDAVVSSVGSEIHDGSGNAWPGWADRFTGSPADRVREVLRRFRWLELQPDEHQSALKASYDIRGLTPSDAGTIRRMLADASIPATLVYSSGLHLDVLPDGAGKGQATAFLASGWDVAADHVLAFGDSGNDLELLSSGFLGTIVANALPELRLAAPRVVYRSPETYADGILDGVRYWTSDSPEG